MYVLYRVQLGTNPHDFKGTIYEKFFLSSKFCKWWRYTLRQNVVLKILTAFVCPVKGRIRYYCNSILEQVPCFTAIPDDWPEKPFGQILFLHHLCFLPFPVGARTDIFKLSYFFNDLSPVWKETLLPRTEEGMGMEETSCPSKPNRSISSESYLLLHVTK